MLLSASAGAEELADWLERSNGVYSVHEAAAAGDMNVLRTAAMDKFTLNMEDEMGRTPLDIAVTHGHAGAARDLLAWGAFPTEQTLQLAKDSETRAVVEAALQTRKRELQLCDAVELRDVPQVRKLLSMGVNPDALTYDKQQSVLMQAAGTGRIWMVRVLLENGANPNYVNPQSKSVLHVAAADGTADVVKRLLAAGADPMAESINGATPLHDAVWAGNLETVRALLPAYRACNYNPDGKRNGSPLNMAIRDGNAEIVRAFIAAGMDLRGVGFDKHPPLVYAVLYKQETLVRELLRAGADPDAKDRHGKSARDYAKDGMKLLLQQ